MVVLGRPSDLCSKNRKWTAPNVFVGRPNKIILDSSNPLFVHFWAKDRPLFDKSTFSKGLSDKDRPLSPSGIKIFAKTVESWDPVSFHHSYNLKIFEDGTDELKMDFAEVNDTKIIINSSKLAPGVLHELKIFSVDMTGRQSPPLSKLFETRKDTNSVENRFFIISRIATTNWHSYHRSTTQFNRARMEKSAARKSLSHRCREYCFTFTQHILYRKRYSLAPP